MLFKSSESYHKFHIDKFIKVFERMQNDTEIACLSVEVIEKFLPQQLSADEIKQVVASIIEAAGATDISALGKIMGIASKQLAGKADGKAISTAVKELLTK